MELSLQFEDNDTAHDDLVLRLAGQSFRCDSYYLALDSQLMPGQEDADKVRVVLRRLLEQWISAVEDIPDGGSVYLPYDFSDQHTGWLRCQRSGTHVDIYRGWAEIEGWSFSPSTVGEYLNEVPGFTPYDAVVQVSLHELTEAIHDSIAKVA